MALRYQVASSINDGQSVTAYSVLLEDSSGEEVDAVCIKLVRDGQFGCDEQEIYISHEDAKALVRALELIEEGSV